MAYITRAKRGLNKVVFKWFTFALKCKRYSGEMDTSLMNSLMNLLFIVFLLLSSGEKLEFIHQVPPTVEGDDSVFAHTVVLDKTILIRLGANAKLMDHVDLNDASFCKLVFDVDTMDTVTNPLESLLNFGYTGMYYLTASNLTYKALLRAKSMSMIYTYPACPILKSLALYGLRVTSAVKDFKILKTFKNLDTYKRDQMQRVFDQRHSLVLDRVVHIKSRLLVAEKYNIPVAVQYDIEKYLDSLVEVQILHIPHLELFCDRERMEHYFEFGKFEEFANSNW
jgi:hypothetical protein